jgi:hypothetical protein
VLFSIFSSSLSLYPVILVSRTSFLCVQAFAVLRFPSALCCRHCKRVSASRWVRHSFCFRFFVRSNFRRLILLLSSQTFFGILVVLFSDSLCLFSFLLFLVDAESWYYKAFAAVFFFVSSLCRRSIEEGIVVSLFTLPLRWIFLDSNLDFGDLSRCSRFSLFFGVQSSDQCCSALVFSKNRWALLSSGVWMCQTSLFCIA